MTTFVQACQTWCRSHIPSPSYWVCITCTCSQLPSSAVCYAHSGAVRQVCVLSAWHSSDNGGLTALKSSFPLDCTFSCGGSSVNVVEKKSCASIFFFVDKIHLCLKSYSSFSSWKWRWILKSGEGGAKKMIYIFFSVIIISSQDF